MAKNTRRSREHKKPKHPKSSKKAKSPKKSKRAKPRTAYVYQVGEVELSELGHLPRELLDGSWQPDKIPSGAVRGDIRRQYGGLGTPFHYWFEDRKNQCVQCDEEFVFTAKEQKYWYESLGFHLQSKAIRCVRCRKFRRSGHAIRARVGSAREAAASPDATAEDHLELATAITEQYRRFGEGEPDKIVAAARKARRLRKSWPEPLYWESMGHLIAGRDEKGQELAQQFLDEADPKRTPGRLITEANAVIAHTKR